MERNFAQMPIPAITPIEDTNQSVPLHPAKLLISAPVGEPNAVAPARPAVTVDSARPLRSGGTREAAAASAVGANIAAPRPAITRLASTAFRSGAIALLSMLPPAKALEILQRNEKRFHMYDVDLKGAVKRLGQARELGYSINYRGIATGTRTVSVPLSANQHAPLAALTIVALHKRLGSDRIDEVVDLMRRVAARIERTL
jgi:Bacterial transcriptional regulator